MEALLRNLISSGLVRARVIAGINAASLFAGGWTLSHMLDWFAAHATYLSHADAIAIAGTVSTCVAGLVLSVGSAAYNTISDPSNVNAKVIAAAATGDVAAANDPATVKSVKAAVAATPGTPDALNDLVAKLSAGKV